MMKTTNHSTTKKKMIDNGSIIQIIPYRMMHQLNSVMIFKKKETLRWISNYM